MRVTFSFSNPIFMFSCISCSSSNPLFGCWEKTTRGTFDFGSSLFGDLLPWIGIFQLKKAIQPLLKLSWQVQQDWNGPKAIALKISSLLISLISHQLNSVLFAPFPITRLCIYSFLFQYYFFFFTFQLLLLALICSCMLLLWNCFPFLFYETQSDYGINP